MLMRRAVLMTRQAISPRLAIRILLNIAPLREKRFGFPSTVVSIGTTEAGKQPQTARYSPGSGADFNLAPGVVQARAGEVAAKGRLKIRRSERGSGPRIAAEAKEAGPDLPVDPLRRIGPSLRLRRIRQSKDAKRENGGAHKGGCSFSHPRTPSIAAAS